MIEGICEVCGTTFPKNSNNHKYCSGECARIMKREQDYKAIFKYRHQWGMHGKKEIGTGELHGQRNLDFEKEYDLIQKERRRCGLC